MMEEELMQSPPDESRTDLLRARYAELLRLREHVETLENLRRQQPVPDRTIQRVNDCRKLPLNGKRRSAAFLIGA